MKGLPNNLISSSSVQDRKDNGSGDLLSQSLVQADAQDEKDYDSGAAAEKRQNNNSNGCVPGFG